MRGTLRKIRKQFGQQMPLSTLFWPDILMSHLRIVQSRKTMHAVQQSESEMTSSGNADLLEPCSVCVFFCTSSDAMCGVHRSSDEDRNSDNPQTKTTRVSRCTQK